MSPSLKLKRGLKNALKKTYRVTVDNLYIKPLQLIRLHKNPALYRASSYYPDMPARSVWQNYLYQVKQILKHGRANEYYFMYGLDVKSDTECKEYINYLQFANRRDTLNCGNNLHNSTCILRNKLYFDIFASAINIPTPKIVAYYSAEKLYVWHDGFHETRFEDLTKLGEVELFCKENEGECGAGIFKLKISNNRLFIENKEITPQELENKIKGAGYLFQEIVKQHPRMSELYSKSINSMRLVTVRSLKDGKLHIMPSILRIGAHGSFVDNTSQGGLAIGFNLQTGQLNKYGFHKPQFGLRTEIHPDSGMRLSDFHIPMLKEAEDMALRFHSMLKDIHSVGWDIAIGENGPIFIEGNDNWEINGPQVGNRGLRKEFEEYFFH